MAAFHNFNYVLHKVLYKLKQLQLKRCRINKLGKKLVKIKNQMQFRGGRREGPSHGQMGMVHDIS